MDISAMNKRELTELIKLNKDKTDKALIDKAFSLRKKYYGDKVYLRGLIEVSNFCKNDCFYCGIRCANQKVNRYRRSEEEIMSSLMTKLCAELLGKLKKTIPIVQ